MNTTVYISGILLQTVAALIALFQVRQAPRKLPWLLIALSSFLIVFRRLATLEQFTQANKPLAPSEMLTLVISLLFFLGVVLMSRMFRDVVKERTALQASEKALRTASIYSRNLLETSLDPLVTINTEGKITDVNTATEKITGVNREKLIGTEFSEYFTEPEVARSGYRQVFENGRVQDYPLAVQHVSGTITPVLYNASVYRDDEGTVVGVFAAARDISAFQQVEFYREMSQKILNALSTPEKMENVLRRVLAIVKASIKVDAVAIRLKNGNDFPYFVHEGFSENFLLKENSLLNRDRDGGICRDSHGEISLECTCGLIISGKTDPSNPLFTEGGSAWTNDSFPFLDIPVHEDVRTNPRNECIHQGYASVALIPIRAAGRIIGLLQINDRQKGRFNLEAIESLESLAGKIGESLQRKRAEEALRKSEERYRTLADFTYDWEYWLGPDNRFIYCSRACERISGYRAEEFLENPDLLISIVHPDDRDSVGCHIKDSIHVESKSDEREFRILTRSGEVRWIGHACQAVQSPEGIFLGRRASNRDITDRRRAEEALRENETLLRLAGRTVQFGGWSVNLTDRQVVWSDEVALIHEKDPGYSPTVEEAIGFYAPEWRKKVTGIFENCAREGTPYDEELEMITARGNRVWVHTAGEAVRDESGKIIRVQGSFQDITRRKRMEEALRTSEERMSNAFHYAAIGMAFVGLDGRWLKVNPAVLGLLGYTEEELLARTFQEITHPDDLETDLDYVRQMLAGEISTYQMEKRYFHKTGRTIWILLSVSLVHDAEGHPLHFISQIQDITERKRVEQSLRERETRLEESNQLLAGILEHTHMMAVFLDPHFNFIWVNRAYADTCRHEPSFFPGKNHFDLYPDTENRAIFQRVVGTGEPFFITAKPFEFPDQPERGMTYWNWSLIPIKEKTGKVTGLVFTLAEITETIRTQEAFREKVEELRHALEHIRTLHGILPICMSCKKIRDDAGYWQQVEVFVHDHTDADFSHGLCPDCMKRLYPDID